jgi:hypothetical protein
MSAKPVPSKPRKKPMRVTASLRVSVFSDRATFTLPIATTNPLNNAQGFSRFATLAKARVRKEQRATTRMVLQAHLRGWPSKGPWTVTLTRIAPSAGLDSDSLPASCKAIRDGVADALGYSDDRDPVFDWRYQQARGRPREYGVEVRIEERRVG